MNRESVRFFSDGQRLDGELCEQLLRFSIEHLVVRIGPRPPLLAHGTANDLYLPEEAQRLYDLAGQPRELHLLEGAGHSEWMHAGNETFQQLIALISDFVRRSPGSTAKQFDDPVRSA